LHAQSYQLYQLLIAPIEPYLAGYRHLIIEPDGILRVLPFEILRNREGNYLGERFDLSFSLGVAYLARVNRWTGVEKSWRAIVISATEIPGADPLPDVEDETRNVAKFFPRAKVVTAAELAKTGAIRDLARAQVVHFSGHAIASMQLAGPLIGDSLTLPYWGENDSNRTSNKLVVLAACSTSRGTTGFFDDEDSLVRRLAGGGVSEVVASRWMVDSTATARLMNKFYEELFAGKSVAAALAAARIWMRATPEYAHPFYWAGFSVFGHG
jgi:CHAT domain-containing protein